MRVGGPTLLRPLFEGLIDTCGCLLPSNVDDEESDRPVLERRSAALSLALLPVILRPASTSGASVLFQDGIFAETDWTAIERIDTSTNGFVRHHRWAGLTGGNPDE